MAALTSALMVGAAVVGAGSSLAGGYAQSEALKAKAYSDKSTADINARFSGIAADDALARGEKDAAKVRRTGRRVIGSQRAALAAQGLDPDQGSGLDLQSDTAALAAEDALTIKNNAWREAWGYRVQAVDATARGRYAEISGRTQARASILSGGLEAMRYGLQAGSYATKGD